MNLTLFFLILSYLYETHPNVACFADSSAIKESKWKNKENNKYSSNSGQNWHTCSWAVDWGSSHTRKPTTKGNLKHQT